MSAPSAVWKHSFMFTHTKGKMKITCTPCGVHSPWIDGKDQEAIAEWCNTHSGLRFQSRREH